MLNAFVVLTCLSISNADVLRDTTLFAKKLCSVMPQNEENLVYSPLSLHTALSLLYQGSNGQTATDLSKALSLPNAATTATEYKDFISVLNTRGNVTIEFGDKIYVANQYKLKPDFKKVTKEYFSAEAENIEFGKSEEAAATINTWVRNKTHDKIDNLVSASDFSPLTRVVLLNAIYFKGLWEREFKKSATTIQKFYVTGSKTVECEMMHQNNHYLFSVNRELEAQILKIPYKDSRFSMLIVLPNNNTDLNKFKEKLVKFDLHSVLSNLVFVDILLSLPKFKIESSLDLKDPLKQLGLSGIFGSSDFSNMLTSREELIVSKVVQKAFVEVNEEGTEAAAVTGIQQIALSAPLHVVVDHPFVFFIIVEQKEYEREVILFSGRVNTIN